MIKSSKNPKYHTNSTVTSKYARVLQDCQTKKAVLIEQTTAVTKNTKIQYSYSVPMLLRLIIHIHAHILVDSLYRKYA